jgi:hypothetical protein
MAEQDPHAYVFNVASGAPGRRLRWFERKDPRVRPALLILALLVSALAACSTMTSGNPPLAFEDCYNRAPLYQIENGCYEGH